MRRLTILFAALGALLLVPVAAASAEEEEIIKNVHVTTEGSGSGKVVGTGEAEGTPPLNCEWNGKTATQSGACDVEAGSFFGFFPYIAMRAEPAEGAAGSVFAGWTIEEGSDPLGSCAEPLNPNCGLAPGYDEEAEEYNGEVKVRAAFKKAFTVEKVGVGTVVGANSGMECTPFNAGSSCSKDYTGPETITASPAEGYVFSKWKGCTVATGLKCEVASVSAATLVIAYFVPTNTLTVEKAGSGYGTAKATGISCDESCSTASSAIQSGKVVKVTTAPAKGSEAAVLEGGTGSASGCSGTTCEFTIEANSSVKVKFVPKPTSTLTLNLTGPGAYKGKVTGKSLLVKGLLKSAFNCGVGCTSTKESFFASDEVELTATAPTGYSFGGWTVSGGSAGTCTGKTTPCKLLSDANKTISAKFE